MKEIEIRYKLNKEELNSVKNILVEKAGEQKTSFQHDTYFCSKIYIENKNTKDCPYVIRTRVSDKDVKLTYKSFQGGNGSSWVEYETPVGDQEVVKKILNCLDQVSYLEIKKNRLRWKLEDIEINIDNIEKLGDFIELEIMSENENEARAELFSFAVELGLSDAEVITKGYVQLMEEVMS